MSGLRNDLTNQAVYGGNLYLAPYAEDMFDIPLAGSQYLFESDSVPFVQMVYKGHVDMYTDYLNIGNLSHFKILKMIEYGMYPSFILSWEDSTALQDTPCEELFSTAFKDWKDRIADVKNHMQQALAPLEGAQMQRHEMCAEGIVRITYDNSMKLYVNYTGNPVTVDGITVETENYAVKEG